MHFMSRKTMKSGDGACDQFWASLAIGVVNIIIIIVIILIIALKKDCMREGLFNGQC